MKKTFDLKMHQANWKVSLMLDNLASHNIAYQPIKMKIKFFEPNLTPFVQPLNLDDADKQDVYNISLIEAMFLAKDTWHAISLEMIKNCWDHSRIHKITSCFML